MFERRVQLNESVHGHIATQMRRLKVAWKYAKKCSSMYHDKSSRTDGKSVRLNDA